MFFSIIFCFVYIFLNITSRIISVYYFINGQFSIYGFYNLIIFIVVLIFLVNFDRYIIWFFSAILNGSIFEEIKFFILKNKKNFMNKYFHHKNRDDMFKYKAILFMLLVYISICAVGFSFYRLAGGEWNQQNASNIINIFIWATYLIAPMVVIWAYINWKSPKQYELEKQYAEKLLENINEVYFYMFERVNNLKYLSTIDQHVVLLNGVEKNSKKYSDTPFYLAHGYLNLLNSLANEKINKSFLINFERMAQLLDGHSNYIEEKYVIYYGPLSDDLKNNYSITCTPYDGVSLNNEQRLAKFQLNRYLTEQLDSESIEENGDVITFNLTFKELIDRFKEEYELLVDEIVVKYIKIKED